MAEKRALGSRSLLSPLIHTYINISSRCRLSSFKLKPKLALSYLENSSLSHWFFSSDIKSKRTMLKLQFPLTGDENLRPKSCRKPLQPKNSPVTPLTHQNLKPKQEWIEFSVVKDSNKENHPIFTITPTKSIIEPLDSALAEELSVIKKKLEWLRLDRERTEKMLKEREMVMDLQMKELEQRGEVQKRLEIEVDRLYRLKELQSYSMIISPIRTLREKELEKKTTEVQPEETRAEDLEESEGENVMQSPSSSWGSENSI